DAVDAAAGHARQRGVGSDGAADGGRTDAGGGPDDLRSAAPVEAAYRVAPEKAPRRAAARPLRGPQLRRDRADTAETSRDCEVARVGSAESAEGEDDGDGISAVTQGDRLQAGSSDPAERGDDGQVR